MESSDDISVQVLDAHWGYLYDGDVRTQSASQDQSIYFCDPWRNLHYSVSVYPILVPELLSLLIDEKLNFPFQN